MATTRERKSISEKTRAEDERLREELRHADIEKFKRLVKPLFQPNGQKKKGDPT